MSCARDSNLFVGYKANPLNELRAGAGGSRFGTDAAELGCGVGELGSGQGSSQQEKNGCDTRLPTGPLATSS